MSAFVVEWAFGWYVLPLALILTVVASRLISFYLRKRKR